MALDSGYWETAGTVEVIRCRDCKWYEKMMYSKHFRCCKIGGLEAPDADDFCSYGERREENAAD